MNVMNVINICLRILGSNEFAMSLTKYRWNIHPAIHHFKEMYCWRFNQRGSNIL
jgi:hypothetical protein